MDRKRIKIIAIEKGQKLGEVAEELGVNPSWLSEVIAGKKVSVVLAKSIERWSGGKIKAAEILGV